jgi:hypothetical protein
LRLSYLRSTLKTSACRGWREIIAAAATDATHGPLGQHLKKDQWFFDLAQWSRLVFAVHQDMKPPGESRPGKEAPKPKPSRLEEARQIIEEYAADLREIIKKLRQHLH